MPGHDVIVIGASAGGIEALSYLVGQLPPDFPAALLVVVHLGPGSAGHLARILARAGRLPAALMAGGEAIRPGRIYVAPPGRHMIVHDGTVQLMAGPRVNHNRPAIDPLFRSAARAYGERVVGVVLTGLLDDGTAGLMAIKQRGGIAVAQDPADATYRGMPRSAVENVDVDYVAPLAEIPALLARLAGGDGLEREKTLPDDREEIENGAGEVVEDMARYEAGRESEGPTVWTCPECGGVLWEVKNGEMLQFRCHVGHLYSPDTFFVDQEETLEAALWTAVRALEERAALARRLAVRMRARNALGAALGFDRQAAEAEQHADVVRDLIARQAALQTATHEVESTEE